ncbi:hypothetical protein BD769DRAFT_1640162 [Suillus cothurnatus]|nr:hypothetical protein BD769DRAFT_1640162 [Suillus cothurnatus]
MDLPWLCHFHPSLMQMLILLPVEHGGEMPSNVQDHLRLYGEIVQASNDQWPQIKHNFFSNAFYHYLRGSGHANNPLFSAFTIQEGATADPNYCAHCFIKVLSGIHLLPPTTLRLFKINLVQHIPDSVTFNGQYNINEDVILLLPHMCLYTMDVFINPPLIKYLQNPSNDPQELTAFDRCLHYAFLEAGDDGFNARMPITV